MFRLPSIYRIAQVALDAITAVLALLLAFWVRFEGTLPAQYWPLIEGILLVGIPVRLVCHWGFGVYRQIWRLFSLRDFWTLFQAGSFYSLSLVLLTRLLLPKFIQLPALPLGVAVMDWGFCLAGMTGIRFLRSWQTSPSRGSMRHASPPVRRLLLLGAGRAGAQIVRETRQNDRLHFRVVGFLDDDPSKLGRQVEGIKVLGKISQLVTWATRLSVDEVLITMPSASSDRIQQVVTLAKREGIAVKIVPPMQELLSDQSLTRQIREIRLEDLLGRPEVVLDFNQKLSDDFPSATEQIQNHVVLVTGAGGTIGSELCRQLAKLHPRQLILLGRGENSIFHIDQELRQTFPSLNLVPVIADIRNTQRVADVCQHYSPDVIFHAAAHKHVPLMEQNPTEAIENNAIASAKLALLADRFKVKTFVLISTDKAVAPSSFMGLSKRLAELLVSGVAQQSHTRFLSVRFGNVLGSRGSVVPIFERQIAQGGPVTVTDPTMTRYFMTTPEATRLVLQSLAVGETGQIMVLDMGQPMRIYTLAEQLIRLKGYVPNQDIAIAVTGIRPGEKLHETLVDANEELRNTPHPRLRCLVNKQLKYLPVQQTLEIISTVLNSSHQSSNLETLWCLLSTEGIEKWSARPKKNMPPPSKVGVYERNDATS